MLPLRIRRFGLTSEDATVDAASWEKPKRRLSGLSNSRGQSAQFGGCTTTGVKFSRAMEGTRKPLIAWRERSTRGCPIHRSLAAEGYVAWRSGYDDVARLRFEAALQADGNHQCSLAIYAQFLEEGGDQAKASDMRHQLSVIFVQLSESVAEALESDLEKEA
jgi:hypothetical protein